MVQISNKAEPQKVCRICWEEDDGSLLAPCSCKDSYKYAHRECLRSWAQALLLKYPTRVRHLNRIQKSYLCEICSAQIPFEARMESKRSCVSCQQIAEAGQLVSIVGLSFFMVLLLAATILLCLLLVEDQKPGLYIIYSLIFVLPFPFLLGGLLSIVIQNNYKAYISFPMHKEKPQNALVPDSTERFR